LNVDHQTVEKVSEVATYGGGIGAFVAGMTANEIAAFGGLLIAFIGLIVNTTVSVYFKQKHLQLRIKQMKGEEDEG
jgi:hypothetical protein